MYATNSPYLVNDTLRFNVIVRIEKQEELNYDSKKATGYVGLKNQGATCYMNSLLQTLYNINYFRQVPGCQPELHAWHNVHAWAGLSACLATLYANLLGAACLSACKSCWLALTCLSACVIIMAPAVLRTGRTQIRPPATRCKLLLNKWSSIQRLTHLQLGCITAVPINPMAKRVHLCRLCIICQPRI